MPPKMSKAQKKKLAKMQKEEEERARAKAEEERLAAEARANQKWQDCLEALEESVPRLRVNPWLVTQEAGFVHNYLDSLTHTLANISKHEADLERVRTVLQSVYEAFVDVGKFALNQPAFFISNPHTIRRFVRLLEQVAHRESDKALFPNVLSLLTPTFEREELYNLLADARIVDSIMSFARTGWMPTPSTLELLLKIIKLLSVSPRLRTLFQADGGFEKLQHLATGDEEGFTKEQQEAALEALLLFPPPSSAKDGSA